MFIYYRSDQWVVNSRREDLKDKSTEHLNKGNVMCHVHFEDNQFTSTETKRRLLKSAVPTLFDVPNPPPLQTPKRPAPKARAQSTSQPKRQRKSGKQHKMTQTEGGQSDELNGLYLYYPTTSHK